MDDDTVVHWYGVHVKPHKEAGVVRELSRKTIPTFLPLIEVTRRCRSHCTSFLEPLFQGYLFVQLEPLEFNPSVWHAVRWTPGVKYILGNEDTPVPVSNDVVNSIQERVKDLGFVRPGLRFAQNDRVVFQRGPFVGLEAVFDGTLSRSGRVRVLMELLGHSRTVQVDAIDLELA